jgi:hypothetical protein
MHPTTVTFNTRVLLRRVLLLSALSIGVSVGIAARASAQAPFTAGITSVLPKPDPCPGNAFLCGTAITNYGPATWTLVPISDAKVSYDCGVYEAATTFALEDGSMLVLDEKGTLCQPGNALSAPGAAVSYGNPFSFDGSWTVVSAEGRFAPVTGSGTDALKTAGARATGSYSQTG